MITSQNESNKQKYQRLFAKATAALGNEIEITSLDQYFGKIEELKAHDSETFSFLLVPADEEPLDINANSREINLPMVIKKFGAGVQGDQLAETLVFKIDRYFDFMDLLSTTIYIQWELPDGTEGASKVILKDIETEPGKIIFGWTLTDKVTPSAGKIKFSVRFFKKNAEGKVEYSFNTLAQTIVLNPALQINIQDELNVDDASKLFETAITNSAFTEQGTDPAQEPSFNLEGLNLKAEEFLINGELLFKAKATTADTGAITYEWKYAKGDTTITLPNVDLFEPIEGIVEEATVRDIHYVKDTTVPTGYSKYQGGYPTAEGVQLYNRYASLKIQEGDTSITGRYWVIAKNTLNKNTSLPVPSNSCVIPAPATLEFVTDLKAGEIIGLEETKELKVVMDYDHPENTTVTYEWKKKDSDNAELTVGANSNTLELKADEDGNQPIGWYTVTVTSELNNDTKQIVSTECKVTNPPVAPVITSPVEDVTENRAVGEIVDLSIVTTQPDDLLFSEGYTYTWYRENPDVVEESENRLTKILKDDDDIKGGLDTNTLQVKVLKEAETRIYVCVVENHLNGTTAATESPAFYVL